MRDHIVFARLISQITQLCGFQLDKSQIENLATTFDEFKGVTSAAEVNTMLSGMQTGRKIEVIKSYRTLTGMGLKESKDAIERYWTHYDKPIPDGNDDPF